MGKAIYTTDEIIKTLEPIFYTNGVRKAVLFGSYSGGMATENSDVDILVDSGLKGIAFFGLLEDVSEALDDNVDLIDITQVIPDSKVEEEINRNGIVIYER